MDEQLTPEAVETIRAKFWPEDADHWKLPTLTIGEVRALLSQVSADAERIRALEEQVRKSHDAIAEFYRYQTGGETRGSYDGKPEREGLWRAMYAARPLLNPTQERPA